MLDFKNILGQYPTDPDIWNFFDLDPDERKKIEWDDHAVDNESVASYTNKEKGLELVFGQIGRKLYLNVIFLHSKHSEEGFSDYNGKFPDGMKFGLTKEEIISKCGVPDVDQPAKLVPLLGKVPPIIVYDELDGCKVAADFRYNKSSLLTISLPAI